MFEVVATLCLWYTAASPENPICFINAKVLKMEFQSLTGCELVIKDLARSLDADLRAKQIGMGLTCRPINKSPGVIDTPHD